MRIIVTHDSPDLDAITSIWLIKRFLSGWEDAKIQFVPAGERMGNGKWQTVNGKSPIEQIDNNEVIHVDTGLGPLDHHQIDDDKVSAASLTFDYIRQVQNSEFKIHNSDRIKTRIEALKRIVKVVVDIDHFKEVFWENPVADHHEFSLVNILDGLKLQKPNKNKFYIEFIIECLDAILHEFDNRIWTEREIEKEGIKFNTSKGMGIGFQTINDSVIKLAQKMGYILVVRKDPRKGYVRIKAKPSQIQNQKENNDINLTFVYKKLKKMDPQASWYLHIGKKMLLNGSVKNPKMKATRLALNDIIQVLKEI